MANLEVDFCGHKLRNPLIAGSCDFGRSTPQFARVVASGVGGVVMKSLTDAPPLQGQNFTEYLCLNPNQLPWKQGQPVGGFFSRGGGMLSETDWLAIVDDQLRLSLEHDVLLIGNICASIFENWAHMARMMVEKGITCLELNFGNPHFIASQKPMGAEISQAKDILVEIIKSVRSEVNVPILVKLSPQVSDMVGIVKASLHAGAEAVTVSHRFQGLIIDVETQTPLTSSWGGYGGSWQVPISMAYVARVAQATKAVICGSAGVSSANDVLQFIMSGAAAVQLTTALIVKGFGLVHEIIADLQAFCQRHKINRLEDMRGAALGAITEYAKLPQRPPVTLLNESACELCSAKPCYSSCYFDAISIGAKGAPEIIDICTGCGFCLQMCPIEGTLGFKNSVP
jgi:dihydropyrimidine dehydrogenase (NAD+) subunit PreA